MLTLNGKDLANNYLERKGVPISWISISSVFYMMIFNIASSGKLGYTMGLRH